MKIALVCDFLVKMGGAQKVLHSLHEVFPDAPIYCLLYDQKGTKDQFKECKVVESRLGKLPKFIKNRPKFLLSQFPRAIEQFDFSQYDIVISSSDSFSHGIITKPKTFHVCYCHTPMRYAWDWYHEYLRENKIGFGLKGIIVRYLLHKIRLWDKVAADRVDFWLANSENVRERIAKFYRADAKVIYPPVDIEKIIPSENPPEEFYLIVSRLEPYKRTKLAVEAFNQTGKKLIIIGEGSEKAELKQLAKENVKLLGWQDDKTVYDHLRRCKGFLFPVEDDFGIAPVEAFAAGRPVVAYGKGGALETVIDGETGVFFDELSVESLNEAINRLEDNYKDFTPAACHARAEKFSKKRFLLEIEKTILSSYDKYQNQP